MNLLIIAHSHSLLFLAKHRVTSEYLVAKIGLDPAENEPSKDLSVGVAANGMLVARSRKQAPPA